MSEEEKESQDDCIEKIIGRKMLPIYFINGGMALTVISIFIAIAWPIRDSVSTLQVDVSKCITSEESYRNFLSKGFYHQLQKDEHLSDIEAIKEPGNSEVIYMRQNNTEAEMLDIRYRGTN